MKKLFILLLFIPLLALSGCGDKPETLGLTAMDTYMKITAYGCGSETMTEARRELQRLDAALSVTDEGSEIFALNRDGEADLSPEASDLLAEAVKLCRETNGALDISIYPVTRAWGFTADEYRVPPQSEIDELLRLVGYENININGNRAELPDGVMIDLGSVAKGYAADRLAEILKADGVKSAILDLGGNIQLIGGNPDGSGWRVGVKDPVGDGSIGVLTLKDKAVVTSGGYERYFEQDGEIYWHIIDPSTGRPADSGLISVTVVGDSGTRCDGLSTALFVMGLDKSADFWRKNGGFEAIFVTKEGEIWVTEGLGDCFEPSDGVEYQLIGGGAS